MNPRAAVANTLWAAVSLPGAIAFERSLRSPAAAQESVLHAILRRSIGTTYGRDVGLTNDVRGFRSRVPLSDYADYEPYIARIRAGEKGVLSADPITHLATTSGTTSALKLIPYNAGLQAQFSAAVGPWMTDLFRSCPSLLAGPAYWSISPAAQREELPSKVPIGFEDDSAYLGGFAQKLVDAAMAVPSRVARAKDMDDWRAQTIAHLRDCRDLRLISVWHPSFLSLLLDAVGEAPSVLWPRLKVVSCWADANATPAAQALGARLPGVTIQPKGLIATEAIVSIPYRARLPLAVRSHFFEFLDDAGRSHLAHELRDGAEYRVVVTTAGGLLRYRLHDRVRVDSFVHRTPSIRFLGKSNNVSDHFGEKLSEPLAAAAIAALQRLAGGRWPFVMMSFESGRYVLWVESEQLPPLDDPLDAALRANPHYDYARSLGQLAAATVRRVAPGATDRFLTRMQSLGQRRGDIKPTALSRLSGWHEHLHPVR